MVVELGWEAELRVWITGSDWGVWVSSAARLWRGTTIACIHTMGGVHTVNQPQLSTPLESHLSTK